MNKVVRNSSYGLILTVIFALLVSGSAFGEPLYDIVEVDLNRPVDIGPQVLQPGHYRFEQVNGRTDPSIFKVTGEQGEIATLTSVGFDAYKTPDVAKKTKLVLKKVGDKYYLDQIWIEGQAQGYEFPHPDVSRAELRGGSQEDLPGKRSQMDSSSQASAGSNQSGTQSSSTSSNTASSSNTTSDSASGSMNAQNTGATTQANTGSDSTQSVAGATTSGANTTATGNSQQFEGCIIGPVGGSYMLDISGKRYVLRGDYDNMRESLGRIVTLWGVSEQGSSATAEPLAIAVQRVTPQSEMCDSTTGARLGSSGSTTTASSQPTGGTAGAMGSDSSTNTTSSSGSATSSIGSQAAGESQQTDATAGVKSVTGCLESSGANSYSIKAAETGNNTHVVPDGRIAAEIANHVGHQVRLVGNWTETGSATSTSTNSAMTPTSSSSSSSMGSGAQHFRAERIDVISLSCASQ